MDVAAFWTALSTALMGLLSGGALMYWRRQVRRSGRITPRVKDLRVKLRRWADDDSVDENGTPALVLVDALHAAQMVWITLEVELWNGKDIAVEIRDVRTVLRDSERQLPLKNYSGRTAPDHITIPGRGSTEFTVNYNVDGEKVQLLEQADNLALTGYTFEGKPVVLQLCDLHWPASPREKPPEGSLAFRSY